VTRGLAEPDPTDGTDDPARAVELLERALGYTRVVLADVVQPMLGRPTPCAGWTLGELLRHMEDALDAFAEAAAGRVGSPRAPVPEHRTAADRVAALQHGACRLLGAWSALPAAAARVEIGDRVLPGPRLVGLAALEITVHGWDVGRATGRCPRIPAPLAAELLVPARRLVRPEDRGLLFARPRPTPAGAAYDDRLLGFLGRDLTGPRGADSGERDSPPGVAS
jgi:uncharacterized protein (TIGR03086 family)